MAGQRVSLKPYHSEHVAEAGCDEAGRGCLAGPVVAAAAILPADFYHPLLNDSKQLTEKQRKFLKPIIEQAAIAYAVAAVDNQKIDEINILNASILAMHLAVDQLAVVPELLLIDGNRFKPYKQIEHKCIVKGDSIYASIAAASVLAKTTRDELMEELHTLHPQYGWNKNKGYPTKEHRQSILAYGASSYHRISFKVKV